MERRKFIITTGAVAATGAAGVSAYTSATVNRDADVTVVADDDSNAQLQLNPGSEGGVKVDSNGQLVIDGVANSNNLTPNGTFTFGDTSSPSSTYAFNIVNQLSAERKITIAITNVVPTNAEIVIELYNGSDTLQDTAKKDGSGSGSDGSITLAGAATGYAVLKIVTGDDDTNVTADVTLSSDPTL